MLELSDLTCCRARASVVSGVTCCVEPGKLLWIIGPNGAGKSTLLRALAGLESITGGRALFKGKPFNHSSPQERAKLISFLPQRAPLFGTPLEIVSYAARIHGYRSRSEIYQILEQFSLTDFAKESVSRLSGGEMQRVWLAAIYAQETPIVLLDEAASSLDPLWSNQFLEGIHQFLAAGKIVLSITHDLMMIGTGEILRIKDGKALPCITAADFIADPKLAHTLFGVSCSQWRSESGIRVSTTGRCL